MNEAENLLRQGVREITLIGQDTTCYGEDLGLKDGLAKEVFGFVQNGGDAPRAEFTAQLRDDAETAGMIATFGNLDIGGGARRGEDARRLVAVKIAGKGGGGTVPGIAAEPALLFAEIAFGP